MAAKSLNTAIEAPETSDQAIAVPLVKLFRSPLNVRKQLDTDLTELCASILAHGVLQNLIVTAEVKRGRRTGRYGVVAGGRRLEALRRLVEEKRIGSDTPVRCIEVDDARALEISIAENSARLSLSPADEVGAYKALSDSGKSVAEIAAAFGISTVLVAGGLLIVLLTLAVLLVPEVRQLRRRTPQSGLTSEAQAAAAPAGAGAIAPTAEPG